MTVPFQMSSGWPKEYLSLPKGEQENYSEVGGRMGDDRFNENKDGNEGVEDNDAPGVRNETALSE